LIALVESVGECQFGTTFKTEIVVAFDDDGTITFEDITTKIEESYEGAVNEVYDSDANTIIPPQSSSEEKIDHPEFETMKIPLLRSIVLFRLHSWAPQVFCCYVFHQRPPRNASMRG
jgi:hypothetical protein